MHPPIRRLRKALFARSCRLPIRRLRKHSVRGQSTSAHLSMQVDTPGVGSALQRCASVTALSTGAPLVVMSSTPDVRPRTGSVA